MRSRAEKEINAINCPQKRDGNKEVAFSLSPV
jgi:hypothetical protein